MYHACEMEHSAAKCEVGDLVNKLAPLAVAGRRREMAGTRRFFTVIAFLVIVSKIYKMSYTLEDTKVFG
jgi:hypothetical protein